MLSKAQWKNLRVAYLHADGHLLCIFERYDDVWARAVEGKDDAYYVALALDHHGAAIRDNSRTDLIAMGKELDNV